MTEEIEKLETELAEAQGRFAALGDIIKSLRSEMAQAEAARGDLETSYYGGPRGKIPDLRQKLARAKWEYETSLMPEVRVVGRWPGDKGEVWRFFKKTPKRIYLRGENREEFWGIDGTRLYGSGPIHPDDLAKILNGTIK